MEIPKHIFRAYDIRGLLAEVTPEIAKAVGQALVVKTGAKTVIVGRDMRETSPELQKAAIEAIVAMGVEVIDIGLCTTSMFNFAVSQHDHVDAGLMVTASHNPPEYNGIKLAYASGLPISGTEILETILEVSLVGPQASESIGNVTKQDILFDYIEKCVSTSKFPDLSGTKIVIDYGNGMGAMSLREICKRLNVSVVELYPEPDAHFPNHEANPAKEENLVDLKVAVLREHADFGIGVDGDADRIGFVDNEGNSLRGDLLIALIAKDELIEKPGAKIVADPRESWIAFETITKNGGNLIVSRIGRKFAIEAVQKERAAFGGEFSGHLFFEEFHGLESVDYATVRVLSLWKRSGQTFADLVRPLRAYANSGEVNMEVHDINAVLKKIDEKYVSIATSVNKLDGIRCEFNHDWWFLVRPSNTEPIMRLTVEAMTEELMKEKRDELVALIQESI